MIHRSMNPRAGAPSSRAPFAELAEDAVPWSSTAIPTDEQLYHIRIFEEPLLPLGGASSDHERRELGLALRDFLSLNDPNETDGIEAFLRSHPSTSWRASLLTNLGIVYRKTGRNSRAMEAWASAWQLAREAKTTAEFAVAERAVSELATLYARVGARSKLERLLDDLEGLTIRGSAYQRISQVRWVLSLMQGCPEESFLCGAQALGHLRSIIFPGIQEEPRIRSMRSTPEGLSLRQLNDLGIEIGMPVRQAFRSPGAPVVAPALVHWQTGHFGVIVRSSESMQRFLCRDTTHIDDTWVTSRTIDEESSGWMLIPSDIALPDGWYEAPTLQHPPVWGRGAALPPDPRCWSERDTRVQKCCCGMPQYNFHLLLASLRIDDTPIWLNFPVGPRVEFTVSYNQADTSQSSLPRRSHLGHKWTFNWDSFIKILSSAAAGPVGMGATSDSTFELYMRGGGTTSYQFGAGNEYSTAELRDRSRLRRVVDEMGRLRFIERHTPNGWVERFEPASGMNDEFRLASVSDGINIVTLTYRPDHGQLERINNPNGDYLELYYQQADDPYLITSVAQGSDIPGRDSEEVRRRRARFEYRDETVAGISSFAEITSSGPKSNQQKAHRRHLTAIVDIAGVRSTFEYSDIFRGEFPDVVPGVSRDPDFVSAMVTPYGRTEFQSGMRRISEDRGDVRWVLATSPGGEQELVEYRHDSDSPSESDSEWMVPPRETDKPPSVTDNENQYLNFRNSLYWSPRAVRRAMAARPLVSSGTDRTTFGGAARTRYSLDQRIDFSARFAEITHWMEYANLASGVVASTKKPDESRVWYRYSLQGSNSIREFSDRALPLQVVRLAPLESSVASPAIRQMEICHSYEYDARDRLTAVTDPTGRRTVIEYDPPALERDLSGSGGMVLPRSVRIRAGTHVIEFRDLTPHGPQTIVDDSGVEHSIAYNHHGQVLQYEINDGRSRADSRTQFSFEYEHTEDSRATWGLLQSIVYPTGRVQLRYDSLLRVQSVADTEGRLKSFWYDDLDRVTSIIHPNGEERFSYFRRDLNGSVLSDPDGNPLLGLERTLYIDRDGYSVLTAYDEDQRPVLVSRSNPSGDPVLIVRYDQGEYFWGDRRWDLLKTLTDGNGHVTRILADQVSHDDRPRLLIRPDNHHETYTYDAAGRLSGMVDGRGIAKQFKYYLDGRIASVSVPSGPGRWFRYGVDLPVLSERGSGDLNAESIPDERYSVVPHGEFGAGSLQSVRRPGLSAFPVLGYQYDSFGRLLERHVGSGVVGSGLGALSSLRIDFDPSGRAVSVRDALTQSTMHYRSLPASTLPRSVSSTLGGRSLVTTMIQYSEIDRVAGWQTHLGDKTAGALLDQRSLSYSSGGRLRAESSVRWQTWRSYSYDGSARLAAAEDWIQVGASPRARWVHGRTTRFEYDLNSNLRRETDHVLQGRSERMVEVSRIQFAYDAGDRLQSRIVLRAPAEPVYDSMASDGAGNLTHDGSHDDGWNPFNELERVTSAGGTSTFVRDATGRVSSIRSTRSHSPERRLLWERTDVVLELDAASQPVRLLESGGFRDFVRQADYFYLRDARGSVIGLMDNTGTLLKRWSYDAWGVRRVVWAHRDHKSLESPIGFCGYYHHPETGLYLTPTRAYSPALRRWLSRDPIGYAGGDTNLFAYVGGDPVNGVDQIGTDPRRIRGLVASASNYAVEQLSRGSDFGTGSWVSDYNRHALRFLQNQRGGSGGDAADLDLAAAEHMFVVSDMSYNTFQEAFPEACGWIPRSVTGVVMSLPFTIGSMYYDLAKIFLPDRALMLLSSDDVHPASHGTFQAVVADIIGGYVGGTMGILELIGGTRFLRRL